MGRNGKMPVLRNCGLAFLAFVHVGDGLKDAAEGWAAEMADVIDEELALHGDEPARHGPSAAIEAGFGLRGALAAGELNGSLIRRQSRRSAGDDENVGPCLEH